MSERLNEYFLDAVTDTVAKRDAQKVRYRWGRTDEEVRVLTLMADRLKSELEDMVRETYDKAGLPNPLQNLQTVLYPRTTQQTVVSFMVGSNPYRIAAVMDQHNQPVFRGVTPHAAALLQDAKPAGGIKNIEKTIFRSLITMLSDESLSRMRIALSPGGPK